MITTRRRLHLKPPDPADAQAIAADMIWAYARRSGHDVSELTSVAEHEYGRAAAAWDPKRGVRFTTLYWKFLRTALNAFCWRTDRPPHEAHDRAEAVENHHAEWDPERAAEWNDLLESLTPDAREIAEAVVAGPADGWGLRNRQRWTAKAYRGEIRRALNARWGRARARRAVVSLRAALAER